MDAQGRSMIEVKARLRAQSSAKEVQIGAIRTFAAIGKGQASGTAVTEVMDKAIEPDRKSKPRLALIALLSTLVAGFVAVPWAFVREAMDKAKADSQQASRLLDLKRYLAWK